MTTKLYEVKRTGYGEVEGVSATFEETIGIYSSEELAIKAMHRYMAENHIKPCLKRKIDKPIIYYTRNYRKQLELNYYYDDDPGVSFFDDFRLWYKIFELDEMPKEKPY